MHFNLEIFTCGPFLYKMNTVDLVRPRKNICVVLVTRPTLTFYPLPYTFFSQFWSWKRIAEQNNFVLLFSSNFRIWWKNTYQNDDLKRKSKLLCIQSMVLEGKGLKQGNICQKKTLLYLFCLYLIHFQAGLNISRKTFTKKNSILPTYPNCFRV